MFRLKKKFRAVIYCHDIVQGTLIPIRNMALSLLPKTICNLT